MTRLARTLSLGATVVGALAGPAGAPAYAVINPPVAETKELQQFTLSVPTEEESATTRIELSVPPGFTIHSFDPAPPWQMRLRTRRVGGDTVIEKVTWAGGMVPSGENAVFRFIGFPSDTGTYSFRVRQTDADGTVVDWSGPAGSRTQAAYVRARSTIGRPSTPAIVVLVVAGGGLLLAVAVHVARWPKTRRTR
jgi:uncharacterized protein YcnI